jgi:murein DD-endopeptidase MepM/ murein hydrolase activator NlpD
MKISNWFVVRYFWPVLLLVLTSHPALAGTPYPFTVTSAKVGQGYQIIAHNRGHAPISVQVSLTSVENISSDQSFPLFAVIRPNSDTTLATIRAANPARSFRFSTQNRFHPGNFRASHDPGTVYRLPFEDDRSFVIGQAPGGPMTSHNTPDSEQAIDFTMPENTLIVAARNGVVISAESANKFGGQDKSMLRMANHVRILHADDSIATYAHLAPRGVIVGVGQRVEAGTVIGYSGSTGYSSGPHLHFAVHQLLRKPDGFASISVPIRFYVGNPAYVFTPQYLQKVTANYRSPGQPPPILDIKKRARKPVDRNRLEIPN